MSRKTTPKSLSQFSVPKEVYEQALAEINRPDLKKAENDRLAMCHHTALSRFNGTQRPNCQTYFMEAAKQALDDRNFEILYKIISRAMDLRDYSLTQQMHEYMFIAISHDPKITNRDQVMDKFLTRVKQIANQTDREAFLKSAHTIQVSTPEEHSMETSEIGDEVELDDDLSEGSIDLSVFQSIKNELW